MECWNNIINTAMIGTDKKTISSGELPADINDAASVIMANESDDKEEQFLQIASLVFNYRQCGVLPVKKEQISLPVAAAEEKEYCGVNALQTLKDIFNAESIPLLKLWLQHCAEKNQIVFPELLPDLLSTGAQEKKLQTLISNCCGKRGEWLSRFNEAWDFSSHQTAEEQWETGTPEQRKNILKQTRMVHPTQAREWLQQTWTQEEAGTKLSFLDILSVNIGEEDLPFLESLSAEKSKKIKDAAIDLLRQTPGSAIVLQHQEALAQSVFLKKEKAMLGLSSKTVLQFQWPSKVDDAVFKNGISKLSGTKEFTDEEFIIYQLIQSVPPSFWEKQLAGGPEEIIHYFQKEAIGKKMIPALVIAIRKFNDSRWAYMMMQHSEVFYIDLIPLLPLQQQDSYSNKYFEQYPDSIINHAVQREDEWSIELTKQIFRHAAKNPYQYNRSFYNNHIHLIPAKIALELERCTPAEEHLRSTWSNISDYILKLLQLKSQIKQAFNDRM